MSGIFTCGQNPRPIDEDLSKEVGVTYKSPPSRNQQFTSAGRRQSLQIWKKKQKMFLFGKMKITTLEKKIDPDYNLQRQDHYSKKSSKSFWSRSFKKITKLKNSKKLINLRFMAGLLGSLANSHRWVSEARKIMYPSPFITAIPTKWYQGKTGFLAMRYLVTKVGKKGKLL